jgi:RimJ/RimL family protein N-acetyltransferase
MIDFHETTTTFVGMLGLLNIDALNDSCAIGILISPEHYRYSKATEVLYFEFNDKQLHRVKFETVVYV